MNGARHQRARSERRLRVATSGLLDLIARSLWIEQITGLQVGSSFGHTLDIHVANEERLLRALSTADRRKLGELVRALLSDLEQAGAG